MFTFSESRCFPKYMFGRGSGSHVPVQHRTTKVTSSRVEPFFNRAPFVALALLAAASVAAAAALLGFFEVAVVGISRRI